MSGNNIPSKPSLHGQSAAFLDKARALNASTKTGSTNPNNALAGKRCSVGSGENRAKAQSEGTTVRGIFASLSNGLMSVVHGAKSLLKSISAHAFGPSQPEAPLQPKKAMAAVSSSIGQGVDTVADFLNSAAATKNTYRGLRDAVNPPKSPLDAVGREANDALTDVKGAGQKLMKDAENFFNKLF